MNDNDLNRSLKSIVIGIQFRKNFSIEDNLGKITDEILYSKKSYFNSKFFTNYLQGSINEKVLINSENNNNLIINASNIVFEYFIKNDNSELIEIFSKFHEQIIKNIMVKYKITEINRIGFVKRYLFENEEISKNFIDKTIGKTLSGIDNINLRFSKKITTVNAIVDKEVSDYDNVIYSIIKKNTDSNLNIILDYQRYFVPLLEDAEQIKFDSIEKIVEKYSNEVFLNWINENYEVIYDKTKK